jgi:hypothetical protein
MHPEIEGNPPTILTLFMLQWFQNMRCAIGVREKIYTELQNASSAFPGLAMHRFPIPKTAFFNAGLAGSIPVKMGGTICEVEIRLLLPDKFPQMGPSMLVVCPPNSVAPNSRLIRQNGSVEYAPIYPWNAGQSTLVGLLTAVQRALPASFLRPIGPPSRVGQLAPIAQSVLDANFAESEAANCAMLRYGLVHNAKEIADGCQHQLGTATAELRRTVEAMEAEASRTGAEFVVSPALQAEAQVKGAHEAFLQTMQEAKEGIHQGQVTIQDFLACLRKYARAHFTSVVLPAISK